MMAARYKAIQPSELIPMPQSTTRLMYWHVNLDQALQFAREAHSRVVNSDGSIGQRRKAPAGTRGDDYIWHPIAVAGLVASTPTVTPEMLAAAYLHDVVEDAGVTQDEIARRFGQSVAQLVDWLTDHTGAEDGNRATRARAVRERLACAPAAAQTIKVADVLHNCQSILAVDRKFARVYLPEKHRLLQCMSRADSNLLAMAKQCVQEGLTRLGMQLEANAADPCAKSHHKPKV